MSPRSTFALLGGLCLPCLILVGWEARALVRLRRTEAERSFQRTVLERAILRAVQPSAEAEKTAARPPPRPEAPAAGEDGRAIADEAANVAKVREHLSELQRDGLPAADKLHWGLLLRQFNLPPDRAAQFLAIQDQLDSRKIDIYAEADASGRYHTDPAVLAQLRAVYADADQDQLALLGPSDFGAYRSFCQNASALALANTLNGELPPTDALADGDLLRLSRILGDASAKDAGGFVIYDSVNWAAAEPQAQALLSPSQFSVYQNFAVEKAAEWRQTQLEADHHR